MGSLNINTILQAHVKSQWGIPDEDDINKEGMKQEREASLPKNQQSTIARTREVQANMVPLSSLSLFTILLASR